MSKSKKPKEETVVPWGPEEEKARAQGLYPFEEEKPAEESETKNPYEDFTFIHDILNAPPIEWLVEDIFFDRSFSILGSYTGFGKSLLALSLAKSIADGSPLFDRYKVNRTGKVLYIDEENAHSDLKDRMLRMGFDEKLKIYFLSFKGIHLDKTEHFHNLMEVILKMQPVLVIFDSLVRFHSANENDASEMSDVMAKFRKITNEGIGVLVLHHHNKGMGPLEIRTRGSSDIVGICDVEYSLWKQGDDLILSTVKSRRAHMENVKLSIEGSEDKLFIKCLGTVEDEKAILMLDIQEYLREHPSTITEILEFLSNNGHSTYDKVLRPILLRMIEKGYIRVKIGPRTKKTYFSSDSVNSGF